MHTPTVVNMIAFKGALLLDIAGPMQVFSSANLMSGKQLYRNVLVTQKGEPVETDAGISLLAHCCFQDELAQGLAIIPGGKGVDIALEKGDLAPYIKSLYDTQDRLASICSGSLILAATGLLDDRIATTHWSREVQAKQTFPKVNWKVDRIFTRDENIYTSAGVSTGIDLSLAIVEEDHGRELALAVARELVLFMQRSGTQSQYSNPLMMQASASRNLQDLCSKIIENPSSDWRISDMSDLAQMTERTLHRHFTASLGCSPSQYVERVRLDHARNLYDKGEQSAKRVASLCGFANEQAMRRAFVGALNITPVEYRKRFSPSLKSRAG